MYMENREEESGFWLKVIRTRRNMRISKIVMLFLMILIWIPFTEPAAAEDGISSIDVTIHYGFSNIEMNQNIWMPPTLFALNISSPSTDIWTITPRIYKGPEGGLFFDVVDPSGTSDRSSTWASEKFDKGVKSLSYNSREQEWVPPVDTATIYIDTSVFQHGGVYRYYLRDNYQTEQHRKLGVTRDGGNSGQKTIDLYVSQDTDNGGYKVTRAIVSDGELYPEYDPDSNTFNYSSGKTDTDFSYSVPMCRVKISKKVTGNAADKSRMFTLKILLQETEIGSEQVVSGNYSNYTATAARNQAFIPSYNDPNSLALDFSYETENSDNEGYTSTPSFKDNDYLFFYVPQSTRVYVKEEIHEGDGYTLMSTVNGAREGSAGHIDIADGIHSEPGSGKSSYTTTGIARKEEELDIQYVNVKGEIPMTGIVSKYMPYAIALAVSVLLICVGHGGKGKVL